MNFLLLFIFNFSLNLQASINVEYTAIDSELFYRFANYHSWMEESSFEEFPHIFRKFQTRDKVLTFIGKKWHHHLGHVVTDTRVIINDSELNSRTTKFEYYPHPLNENITQYKITTLDAFSYFHFEPLFIKREYQAWDTIYDVGENAPFFKMKCHWDATICEFTINMKNKNNTL